MWDRLIRRTAALAATNGPSRTLLLAYGRVLCSQKALYDGLMGGTALSGALEQDVMRLTVGARRLVAELAVDTTEELAEDAGRLLGSSDEDLGEMLLRYWAEPSDHDFFPKAVLQAYGRAVADAGRQIQTRTAPDVDLSCPFCGGPPQLSILEPVTPMRADGGGRRQQCAACLTVWPIARVRCGRCGEEDEPKLGYFTAEEFPHVRVDTCDSCKHYVKTIDLGRLGTAEPLVDEVAAAALDVWARERGFEKIELNLMGL